MAMKQKGAGPPVVADLATEGLLILDLSFQPIALDRGAESILNDLNGQDSRSEDALCLPAGIRNALNARRIGDIGSMELHLHVGEHEYSCRTLFLEPGIGSGMQPMVAVYLKRETSLSDAVNRLAVLYHLTSREIDILIGVSKGLTSKELALRMNISPNTVNAFLRLITIKMGVTTRASIVAKLLDVQDGSPTVKQDLRVLRRDGNV